MIAEDVMKLMADEIESLRTENERLKKAITDFGKNPVGFDWAVLEKIDNLEAENERLEWIISKAHELSYPGLAIKEGDLLNRIYKLTTVIEAV